MNDRIKFLAQVGKIHIAVSIAAATASLLLLALKQHQAHAYTMALLAVPSLVTGAFFHMLPSYNRKAPPKAITSTTLIIIPVFAASPRVYAALHAATALPVILYSVTPFTRKHYYQKILAVASYAAMLESAYLYWEDAGLVLAVLYSLAIGMIFAVNTTALTFTYGQKPREKASIILALLHAAAPPVYRYTPLFLALALTELALYAYVVRIEKAPQWIEYIRRFKERSKKIHTNLIASSILAVILYPAWIPYLPQRAAAVHLLSFGFIALNIAAHGPVLIPLALRRKPRPPTLLLPATFALATIAKLLKSTLPILGAVGCASIITGLVLLAYYTASPSAEKTKARV